MEPAILTIEATFQTNSFKLYVPVVTLSINDNIDLLENLEQGFKTAISWDKYRSEKTTQPKNNSLDYMICSTFRNINILFVQWFKAGENDDARNFFEIRCH